MNYSQNKIISITGIPTDINSSFLSGSSKAPPIIMKEFNSDASNKFSENGINLGQDGTWIYNGNINLNASENEFELISNSIKDELIKDRHCISLGGDHSITYPIIAAYHNFFPKIDIIHFDAHPDLYDNYDNNPFSHASPFARIMENNLANSLTQIGIRTMNDHQLEQAERYNVDVITMNEYSANLKLKFENPIYISIDLDSLDPAYAPGVSHPEPGGLSTRDIIKTISIINGEVVGADIVEYNPIKDINNITSITAAKLLKEVMGKILKK